MKGPSRLWCGETAGFESQTRYPFFGVTPVLWPLFTLLMRLRLPVEPIGQGVRWQPVNLEPLR
jgi:hypothetical protein